MVHEVLTAEREDLQIVAEEIRRVFGTGIQDGLQQAVQIVENSAAVEARCGRTARSLRMKNITKNAVFIYIITYSFLNIVSGDININRAKTSSACIAT